LDGKITTYKGISKWITSSYARDLGRILRDKYDAVLVGVNTVIKDNPRLEGLKKSSFKVVLDPDFKIPTSSYLFKNKERLIIFTSLKWKEKIEKKFPSLKIIFLKEKEGLFSLKMVLKKLYRLGIASVFVEGGSFTLGKFFEEKLIDKFYFFISFKLIGGKGALTSLGAKGFAYLKNCPYLKNIEIKRLKKELLISGYPDYF
ncbi:MAG TPA: RibD family protein, partial [Candidatus Omnitrophica bacterium]|nr:RibD family protein [Candidatus Omnitrophota bacterium]